MNARTAIAAPETDWSEDEAESAAALAKMDGRYGADTAAQLARLDALYATAQEALRPSRKRDAERARAEADEAARRLTGFLTDAELVALSKGARKFNREMGRV